jgi:hypothetical protein
VGRWRFAQRRKAVPKKGTTSLKGEQLHGFVPSFLNEAASDHAAAMKASQHDHPPQRLGKTGMAMLAVYKEETLGRSAFCRGWGGMRSL